MKFNFLFLLVFSLLIGCQGVAIKEKIEGNYYLIATDAEEDLSLTYHEAADENNYGTIINATVFAIGHNNEYIIAKQHPRNFPNPPDKSITNFFILPIKKKFDWKTNNDLLGPLTLEQFNEKRKELNISNDLKFTIIKNNLE